MFLLYSQHIEIKSLGIQWWYQFWPKTFLSRSFNVELLPFPCNYSCLHSRGGIIWHRALMPTYLLTNLTKLNLLDFDPCHIQHGRIAAILKKITSQHLLATLPLSVAEWGSQLLSTESAPLFYYIKCVILRVMLTLNAQISRGWGHFKTMTSRGCDITVCDFLINYTWHYECCNIFKVQNATNRNGGAGGHQEIQNFIAFDPQKSK